MKSDKVRGAIVGAAVVAALWLITLVTGSSGVATIDEGINPGQTVEVATTDTDSTSESPAGAETADDTSKGTLGGSADFESFSDLPGISPADLPPEALNTLDLIASGGPFPYRKDDSTFQNREAILPDQPRGYYREYTVDTPGSNDRGARRIVAGDGGDLYYTDDHYGSFSEIVL